MTLHSSQDNQQQRQSTLKYAIFLIILVLVALCYATWLLHDPTIFVVGLFLIPNIIQGMPWMLAATESDDEEQEEQESQNPKAGFHAKFE